MKVRFEYYAWLNNEPKITEFEGNAEELFALLKECRYNNLLEDRRLKL